MSSLSQPARARDRTESRSLRPWLWIGLAILGIAAAALAARLWLLREPAPPPVVDLTPPPIAASGTVLPERRADLSFTTSGRISRLFVREGDRVITGQALARLDPGSMAVDPLTGAGDAYLVAPFPGVVGAIYVREWETVTPGLPVIALGDLDRLRVEVEDLSEADVSQIAVGQPAELTFEAFPGRKEIGAVRSIGLMASQKSGRAAYRVIIDLPTAAPHGTRWGMTVNVDIIVAAAESEAR